MKLVTFIGQDALAQPGVIQNGRVVGLARLGFPSTTAVMVAGDGAKGQIQSFVNANEPSSPMLETVKLLAPVPRPPKIICIGLNYRDHAIESNMAIPEVPTVFCKFASSVIATGENVVLPKNSTKPDYEAEFAVVIGKGGRYIAAENWEEHVYGYLNLNDVSARDYQLATSQWVIGKTFDTFCPMGPYILTKDEVADPHNLEIKITINGEVLQHSNTKHLIFNIPTLIAHLSSVMTLEVGDIISTGTPAGVGLGRTPPRWLVAGDEMVVEVEGLGELRNQCVAEG
ncbi:MAG: fumarylacetoacetate hydrolase family protein [Bryobacterales bacterium]|nr:fumarylacetoacetate hydrolase family protein [Bryobacterales bacterium]